MHQGTHILQSLDGFAFAIGRDGRFLYISETVSMYLGLSQVEMTGSSVFDYTHQQDHEELARQLGELSLGEREREREIFQANAKSNRQALSAPGVTLVGQADCATGGRAQMLSPAEVSLQSHYSAASSDAAAADEQAKGGRTKRIKSAAAAAAPAKGAANSRGARKGQQVSVKMEPDSALGRLDSTADARPPTARPTSTHPGAQQAWAPLDLVEGDPYVRQFCIRMKSTLTKRGCQHFKSSGYRVVHVVAHLRAYQSNDHGHLMDPFDEPAASSRASSHSAKGKKRASASAKQQQQQPRQQQQQQDDGGSRADDQSECNSSSSSSINSKPTLQVANSAEAPGRASSKIIGMVAVAIALPPPSINELRLESDTFVVRLGLDLRITHIEPKLSELLHYPMELLAGRSLYALCHPADVHQLQRCHRDLLRKGQIMSGYYRLLSRSGGFIWVQTCATLICNSGSQGAGQPTAGPASQTQLAPNASSVSSACSSASSSSSSSTSSISSCSTTDNNNHPHQHQQAAVVAPTPPAYSPHSQQQQQQQHYALAPANLWDQQQFASAGLQNSESLATTTTTNAQHQQAQLMQHEQQEQCVIFVNYMITNVIETDQIVDVCQGADFVPVLLPGGPTQLYAASNQLAGVQSGCSSSSSSSNSTTTTTTNNNNHSLQHKSFRSPSPSAASGASMYPSPVSCIKTTTTSSSNNMGSQSSASKNGAHSRTPNEGQHELAQANPSAINLSASQRSARAAKLADLSGKAAAAAAAASRKQPNSSKAQAGRAQAAPSQRHYSATSSLANNQSALDENGHLHEVHLSYNNNNNNHHQHLQTTNQAHNGSLVSHFVNQQPVGGEQHYQFHEAYASSQTSGVNLALANKLHQTSQEQSSPASNNGGGGGAGVSYDASAWTHHYGQQAEGASIDQQQQQQLADYTRSGIYKAAFAAGLAADPTSAYGVRAQAAIVNHHHQQQQQHHHHHHHHQQQQQVASASGYGQQVAGYHQHESNAASLPAAYHYVDSHAHHAQQQHHQHNQHHHHHLNHQQQNQNQQNYSDNNHYWCFFNL